MCKHDDFTGTGLLSCSWFFSLLKKMFKLDEFDVVNAATNSYVWL